MKLDLSQFHPLDHWPGTRRCREHYPHGVGSIKHHLWLAWDCKYSMQVRSATLCKVRRHRQGVMSGRGLAPCYVCIDCACRLPGTPPDGPWSKPIIFDDNPPE